MKDGTPNPGSNEAIDMGCTCPVLDNAHGRGGYISVDGKPLFWMTSGCPIHGIGEANEGSEHNEAGEIGSNVKG